MKIKLNYKILYPLLLLILFPCFLFFSNRMPFYRVYNCCVTGNFFQCGITDFVPSVLTCYLLRNLFPDFEYTAFKIFNIFLDISIFSLMFLILYKEFNKKLPIKYLVFFVVSYLILFPGYTHTQGIDITSILSVFFLLLGFYILFKTNLKFKTLISGFLFSLSIGSKIVSLPTVLVIFLYFSYKNVFFRKNEKLVISKEGVHKLIFLVFPSLFLLIFFIFISPGYFSPLSLASKVAQGYTATFFEAFSSLFSSGVLQLFIWISAIAMLLFMIIIVPLLSHRRPSIYAILALVGYLTFGTHWVRWVFQGEDNYRHLVVTVPFLILSIVLWFKENKSKYVKFIYIGILIFLFYFCFKYKFIETIVPNYLEEPFLHIPADKTSVISDSPYLAYYPSCDPYYTNKSEDEAIESLSRDISQNKYDILIVSSSQAKSRIYQALLFSGKQGNYFGFQIMWLENLCHSCNHGLQVYIRKDEANTLTNDFVSYLEKYYSQVLKNFCYIDNFLSWEIMKTNQNLTEDDKYELWKNFTTFRPISDSLPEGKSNLMLIAGTDFLFLIILFVVYLIYLIIVTIKTKKFDKYETSKIMILTVLIVFLVFHLRTFDFLHNTPQLKMEIIDFQAQNESKLTFVIYNNETLFYKFYNATVKVYLNGIEPLEYPVALNPFITPDMKKIDYFVYLPIQFLNDTTFKIDLFVTYSFYSYFSTLNATKTYHLTY